MHSGARAEEIAAQRPNPPIFRLGLARPGEVLGPARAHLCMRYLKRALNKIIFHAMPDHTNANLDISISISVYRQTQTCGLTCAYDKNNGSVPKMRKGFE